MVMDIAYSQCESMLRLQEQLVQAIQSEADFVVKYSIAWKETEWEWQVQYLRFLRGLSAERLSAVESFVNLIEESSVEVDKSLQLFRHEFFQDGAT